MQKNTTQRWRGLFDAVKHNDKDAVRYWVEEKRVPITRTDAKRQTVAHLAAANDNRSILEYLLRRDSEKFLIKAADSNGLTVFHVAAREGAINVIRALLDEYKQDVNVFEPTRKPPKNSALHLAAENGQLNAFKYLIEEKNGNVNMQNDLLEPPLFLAMQNQHFDVIRYIVERNDVNLTVTDMTHSTILHVAAMSCKNDTTVIEYLLGDRQIQVDVNAKNKFGETALLKAAMFNYLHFVRYLLSARKVDVNIGDFMNKTPLYQAALLGHVNVVKCLVEHGADTEIKDCMGQTPLDATQCEEVINYLKEVKKCKRSRRRVIDSSAVSFLVRQIAPKFAVWTIGKSLIERVSGSPLLVTSASTNFEFDRFLALATNAMKYKAILDTAQLFAVNAIDALPNDLIER